MNRTGKQTLDRGMIAAIVFGFFWGLPSLAAGGPELLERLREQMPKSEAQVFNLRVDGESKTETWDAAAKQWKYSGEAMVTAYYEAGPKGKARVDFHVQIAPWTGGPAPFGQETFTVAYNGRTSQKLHKTVGPLGEARENLRGQIAADRDENILVGHWSSGWEYSIYGFWDYKGQRLSSIFDSSGLILSAEEVEREGMNCVRLQADGQGERHIWYLDPARGFAILSYERFGGPKRSILTRMTVQRLVEAGAGVYYPTEGTSEGFLPDGTLFNRSRYSASNVIANDPSFSETVFTFEWPRGTVVEDKIAGKVFIAGKEQPKPEFPEQRPQVQPAPAVQSAAPTGSGHQRSADRLRVVAFVIGALAVLALVMIGAVRLSRRK
jgi:hypothetical protein